MLPLLQHLLDKSDPKAPEATYLEIPAEDSSWVFTPHQKLEYRIAGNTLVLPFHQGVKNPLSLFESAVTLPCYLTSGNGTRNQPYVGTAQGQQFQLILKRLAEASQNNVFGHDPTSQSAKTVYCVHYPSLQIQSLVA